MDADHLNFSGIDGDSGEPLIPPMSLESFADILGTAELRSDMKSRNNALRALRKEAHLGPPAATDPQNLAKVGWGVIFASNTDSAIYDALGELLAHRRAESGSLYREFRGKDGYQVGDEQETYLAFLARNGVTYGSPNVRKVPYYLLIVGDPEEIPYHFQYMLDAQYAVGRIFFNTPAEYAYYAQSVVEVERRAIARRRRLALVATFHHGDTATESGAQVLLPALEKAIRENTSTEGWAVDLLPPERAYKADVLRFIGGDEAVPLLFVAGHGLAFRNNSMRQASDQGALLCQDWPGAKTWGQRPIPNEHYVAASDISADAHLAGSICFFFTCFGAGTPRLDDFAHAKVPDWRQTLAPRAMVAALPRRLLSHPQGGALAVIGHVDQVWSHSFVSSTGTNVGSFADTLIWLMAGSRVGFAMEPMNARFAEVAVLLTKELEDLQFGKKRNAEYLINLWITHNDARSYVIVGDPAVRLVLDDSAKEPPPHLG